THTISKAIECLYPGRVSLLDTDEFAGRYSRGAIAKDAGASGRRSALDLNVCGWRRPVLTPNVDYAIARRAMKIENGFPHAGAAQRDVTATGIKNAAVDP